MNWALFLLLLFLLCAIVTAIILMVFYKKTKAALYSALVNTIHCGEELCPPVTAMVQPMPSHVRITELDLPTAKYCSTLVYALETATREKTTPKFPSLTLLTEVQGGVILASQDVLWVVFRGSQTTEDWLTDFDLQQTSFLSARTSSVTTLHFLSERICIHEGFAARYQQIREQLLHAVQPYGSKMTIVVTGHSLGAALATLAGIDLVTSGYKNVIVYNFASPRVGDHSFAQLVDQSVKVYRIVNLSDLIPTLPLAVQPNFTAPPAPIMYAHCGEALYFSENWFSLLNNHNMPIYMKGLETL